MLETEIKTAIENAIANSEVQVQLDGNHASVIVISDEFRGLSPVKKQQKVYSALSQAISDGRLHAVNMKTFTQDEWAAQG